MLSKDKRILGILFSVSISMVTILGDDYYGWLGLMLSFFLGLFSAGSLISSIYLGRKALHWGIIGIIPLAVFFGVSAIQKIIN